VIRHLYLWLFIIATVLQNSTYSELAFACDFAIPFALAELSDLLITSDSLELQTVYTDAIQETILNRD
jgi:hypothetical protein